MKSLKPSIEPVRPGPAEIRKMFDRIASRYDLVNTILSFGRDRHWRRRSRDLVLDGTERSVLDLGAGTGRFLRCFLEKGRWERAVGTDFSNPMLQQGRRYLDGRASWVQADFHRMPFVPESFDLVISAFTLRSVRDLPLFMRGIYDILAENGKAAFLCLTRPPGALSSRLHAGYLRFYLPLAGRLLSGDGQAYRFLSESVRHFQESDRTISLMRRTGFRSAEKHVFTFGAATLIIGKK